MPKVTINLNQLRNKVIEQLARNNSSLVYRKQLASELNVGVEFVNNVYNHSKSQINEIRTKLYEEGRKEEMVTTVAAPVKSGVEYMILNSNNKPAEETKQEETKYVPRTLADMRMGRRLTDDQKEHIAHEIEDSSEAITLNGQIHRFIDIEVLKKIAERNYITVQTAERYVSDYTTVKIDKEHRRCKTPKSLDQRRIPQEVRDIVDDLLRTTLLTQYEIADIAGTNQNFVSRYMRNNGIKRPKEGDDVKNKTAKQRKELRRKQNEAESKKRRLEEASKAANPTPEPKPEEKKESTEEKENITVRIKGLSDSKPIPVEVKKPEEEVIVEDKKEETIPTPTPYNRRSRASITELLDNRYIHRVAAETVVECVLVDGRHGTPPRPAIFEKELDSELKFNFDEQDRICEAFIKNHINFNDQGVADKSLKVYCTGLQGPLVAMNKMCLKYKVNYNAYHYNTETHRYHEQVGFDCFPTYNNIGVGVRAIANTFGQNLYRYKCTLRDIEQNTNNLYVIECEYRREENRKTNIVCSKHADYIELFTTITSTLLSNKITGMRLFGHEFNFNTEGEVIKNTDAGNYFC